MGFDKAKAINAAEKCLSQGKIAQAVQEYVKVVEHEPNDYTSLNMLGDLYARLKKNDEAVGHFLRVAEHYREQGFTLKAVAMYKKILRLGVSVPGVARKLATLYEQQGLYVEAREQYLHIAEAAARGGQTRESLEALRRIADFDPKNVDIRLRLAGGCAGEGMIREASDAYVEAGELLLARGDARKALDCYKGAHELNPANHAVLRGLVAACSATGDAEGAAAVLERAASERPDDLELRAMLARTYIDAEDATAAERATEALVEADAANFPLLFEVARLYLRRSYVNEAVRVLARSVEPALSGRQEAALLEILSEALARDPEHIDALKLLLRIYSWQRDDERMHVTLERLAEAAQTQNLLEEERRALEHLVRLVPFDQSYHERLESLGGAAKGGSTAPAASADEAPAFVGGGGAAESHPLYDFDPFAIGSAAASPDGPTATQFELSGGPGHGETAGAPQQFAHADPGASFADLNEDFVAAPAAAFEVSFEQPFEPPAPARQDAPAAFAPAGAHAPSGGSERSEAMLRQELESVDFYLEQGYGDIARDTLDMLERQFGASAEITARRVRLNADGNGNGNGASHAASNGSAAKGEPAKAAAAPAGDEVSFEDFAAFDFDLTPEDADSAATPAKVEVSAATPAQAGEAARPAQAARESLSPARNGNGNGAAPRASALDPGLAAVFDEFREAVEDEQPESQDEDFETHYNLGLAYREMGLLDEAVEQFQRAGGAASDGTPRYLQCCNMLGHCFMQKGMPRPAALWFKRGLDLPDLSDDERQAMRYELAQAYEAMGDLDRAFDTFSEIYGFDVSYRGVAEKLRDLQSRKAVASEA